MLTWSNRANWINIIAALGAAVAAWAQVTTAPAGSQPAVDPEVDEILTRLELREIKDLAARVTWRLEYVIDPDDFTVKLGRIWYEDRDPVARFLIHFDTRISGERRDKSDEQHVFDGRWYTKIDARTKSVERYEVRRPDDPVDPYRVGEGVFPVPFGQKKEEILREFEVTKVPPAEKDPPGTDRLHLVPRQGTQTGESYKELDFWIERDGPAVGLPTRVRVAKLDGTGKLNSYITITFDEPKINAGLEPKVFEITIPAGYTVSEERLEPIAPPQPQ